MTDEPVFRQLVVVVVAVVVVAAAEMVVGVEDAEATWVVVVVDVEVAEEEMEVVVDEEADAIVVSVPATRRVPRTVAPLRRSRVARLHLTKDIGAYIRGMEICAIPNDIKLDVAD